MTNIQLSLAEVQKLENEMLSQFDKFCKENDIRYFLAYGSLLGAVRHSGPIPWDDDMDILVPRPDYERLINLKPMRPMFKAMIPGEEGYPWDWIKLVNPSTVFLGADILKGGEKYGVFIDVFPLDGMPTDKRKAYRRFTKIKTLLKPLRYGYHLDYSAPRNKNAKSIIKKCFGVIARLKPKEYWYKKLHNEAVRYPYDDSDYVTNLYSAYGFEREFSMKERFGKCELHEYMGYKYPIPKDAESILEQVYGKDWRIPIRQEDRIHGTAFWL